MSWQTARKARYRVGEGITGRVVQSGKPVVVPRVSHEPLFLNRTGILKESGQGRDQLHLRAHRGGQQDGRRPGRDPGLQQGRPVRPGDEVLRHRGLDDRPRGAGAQPHRRRAPAARPGEHPAPAEAEGALRLRQHHREQPAHAVGLRAGRPGGADQHHGADPGRVRDRQGDDRPRRPLQLPARGQALHQGELRRPPGEPHRVGAVRLRAGGLYGCPRPEEGALRAGQRRHAFPRRGGRADPRHPGQAPARPPGAGVRAAGRRPVHQGQRPRSSPPPTRTWKRR